jgi:hypothetical protein
MRRLTVPVVLLTMLVAYVAAPAAALGAAPSNDSFKTPTAITSLPYSTPFDLTQATDDPDTPPCEAFDHNRIWYGYTPSSDQVIRASVGGNPAAELALWTVTKPTSKPPQLSGCGVFGSDLIVRLTAGTKYEISVGRATNDPPFSGTLTINVENPPANDAFANATQIQTTPFHDSISAGAGLAATTEAGEPTPSCADQGTTGSAWYRITPPGSSNVSITQFQSFGVLAIYDGTALASMTELSCTFPFATPGFVAEAGHTYYLQVWGAKGADTQLTVAFSVPPVNDLFADRIDLGIAPTSGTADLTVANTEAGEPLPSCAPSGSHTAWWSFTAPTDGSWC